MKAKRRLLLLVASLVAGAAWIGTAPMAALAGIGLGVAPTFPSPVNVGQTGLAASLTVRNTSTLPESGGNVTVTGITLVPSCGTSAAFVDCPAASVDPGVFSLSATGTGGAGTACAGTSFSIAVIDPSQDKYAFTPSGGSVVLGSPGSATDACRIDFTFNVLKVPTKDASPASGLQTAQLGGADGTASVNGTSGTGAGSSITTIHPTTTAVAVSSASVSATHGAVVLRWRTASEVATLGFNVYGSLNGNRVKLNRGLIAATGTRGGSYVFRYRMPAGQKAPTRFWIQIVNLNGSRTWYSMTRGALRR